MDCDEVRVQISDLVDDDQEFQQAKVIHDHLESCSPCTQFYEEKIKGCQLAERSRELPAGATARNLAKD